MNQGSSAAPRGRTPFYRDISFQVLVGMVGGVIIGLLWPHFGIALKPLGDAFIKLIRMVIGPVIFCTVVHGIAKAGNIGAVGRIALKALLYFEVITTFALVIGLVVGNLWQAGRGMHIDPRLLDPHAVRALAGAGAAAHRRSMVAFLLDIIPATAVSAFARGNILEIVLFSVLFGAGVAAAGEAGAPVVRLIDGISKAFFWIIGFVMRFAPLATLGAMAFTVGRFGFATLGSLVGFIAEFYVICLLFVILVLWPVAHFSGFSLLRLMRYLRAELLLVIGTSSSETVFPQLTRKLEQLGCDERVVGLVLPTAYTFNHDGTCLYFSAATLFLAQATGTHLGWTQQLGLLAVLLLTSKGAAGVSGSALVVLAVTLAASHAVPVAAIALIIGIHRFLSAAFVCVNIIGNAVATLVVARWEGALDRVRLRQALEDGAGAV